MVSEKIKLCFGRRNHVIKCVNTNVRNQRNHQKKKKKTSGKQDTKGNE